jgi:SagB-type dehydrogenase family enzyme
MRRTRDVRSVRRRDVLRLTVVTAGGLALTSCTKGATPQPDEADEIEMPEPRQEGDMTLEEAIKARRSVRDYTDQALSEEQVSQLCWAAQGVTDDWGHRAAPSAGALYPLELYVALSDGLYHYLPNRHRLVAISEDDVRLAVWRAGLQQDAIRDAPAVFVVVGVVARTAAKYGNRAERYVWLEAGHAAQNLLLQAVALGLAGVPIGAFHDQQVADALSLPSSHSPLYLVPIGYPQT